MSRRTATAGGDRYTKNNAEVAYTFNTQVSYIGSID